MSNRLNLFCSYRFARQIAYSAGLTACTLSLTACQMAPQEKSGFLTDYSQVNHAQNTAKGIAKAKVQPSAKSGSLTSVHILPAQFVGEVEGALSDDDRQKVINEVDRQICFELSEHFSLVWEPTEGAGTVRTAITTISPTGRAGSALSAAVNMAVPIPLLDLRTPATTGGLSIESEMLAPDGTQMSAIIWRQKAEWVGRIPPSFSRVGDALQLAEPMGDAVGKLFGVHAAHRRAVADPDPCLRYGPRRNVAGTLAGKVIGAGTGLYVPEVEGAGKTK